MIEMVSGLTRPLPHHSWNSCHHPRCLVAVSIGWWRRWETYWDRKTPKTLGIVDGWHHPDVRRSLAVLISEDDSVMFFTRYSILITVSPVLLSKPWSFWLILDCCLLWANSSSRTVSSLVQLFISISPWSIYRWEFHWIETRSHVTSLPPWLLDVKNPRKDGGLESHILRLEKTVDVEGLWSFLDVGDVQIVDHFPCLDRDRPLLDVGISHRCSDVRVTKYLFHFVDIDHLVFSSHSLASLTELKLFITNLSPNTS